MDVPKSWLFISQSSTYHLLLFSSLNRALWSITIRCRGQDLKFIFCELVKPSDICI